MTQVSNNQAERPAFDVYAQERALAQANLEHQVKNERALVLEQLKSLHEKIDLLLGAKVK